MKEIDVMGLLGAIGNAKLGDQIKISDYAKVEDCEFVTFNGTNIAHRPFYLNVGKLVGNRIYVHKNYAHEIIPANRLVPAMQILFDERRDCKFSHNCVRYDRKTGDVTFIESPDFDTADEPMVGWWFTVHANGDCEMSHSNAVYHHKWLWVKPDYSGFDYEESRRRSRYWLRLVHETAIGGSRLAWHAQCDKWGVKHAKTFK